MENKINERKVVLGLTVISIVLVAGMTVMPSMMTPESDVAHGLTVAGASWAAAHGDLVGILISMGCLWAEIAGLCFGGPASLILYA